MNPPPIIFYCGWHREDLTRMIHHLTSDPASASINIERGEDGNPISLTVTHPAANFHLLLPAVRGWLSDGRRPDAIETVRILTDLIARKWTSEEEILAPRAHAAILAGCADDPSLLARLGDLANPEGKIEIDWFEWGDGLEYVVNDDAEIVFNGSSDQLDDLTPMPAIPCELRLDYGLPGSHETLMVQPLATEDSANIILVDLPSGFDVMTEINRRANRGEAK